MASVYPGDPPGSAFDEFAVPTAPEGVPLSSAGDTTRNHPELLNDQGDAIESLQAWAALRTHDHSGDDEDIAKGAKLDQANTHESADTDVGNSSIHHTLGTGAFQASPGNHVHTYGSLTGAPYIVCTSLTRPSSPFVGMMIFETDTLATRMWMDPPGGTGLIWQLLPVTTVPILRAESRAVTQVLPNVRYTCFFTHILEALFFPDVDLSTANTDLVVTEPGLYMVSAVIHWDPQRTYHDHSMIGFTVNGADVSRNGWEYIRGYSAIPGFAQSNSISFPYRFQANDVLRLTTRHNGSSPSFLWWDSASPEGQVNHLELVFHSP